MPCTAATNIDKTSATLNGTIDVVLPGATYEFAYVTCDCAAPVDPDTGFTHKLPANVAGNDASASTVALNCDNDYCFQLRGYDAQGNPVPVDFVNVQDNWLDNSTFIGNDAGPATATNTDFGGTGATVTMTVDSANNGITGTGAFEIGNTANAAPNVVHVTIDIPPGKYNPKVHLGSFGTNDNDRIRNIEPDPIGVTGNGTLVGTDGVDPTLLDNPAQILFADFVDHIEFDYLEDGTGSMGINFVSYDEGLPYEVCCFSTLACTQWCGGQWDPAECEDVDYNGDAVVDYANCWPQPIRDGFPGEGVV